MPDCTTGSALFADISGFTPLTEALQESLGPRQGAEELTRHLDTVYTALITEVDRYGGSVISFAGDAITCWFDDSQGQAAPRATSCAFGLQQAMRAFAAISLANGATATLALKVAVASGPARRFVVGDPEIHYIDVLAGATVARTAAGEHVTREHFFLTEFRPCAVLFIRFAGIDYDCDDAQAHLDAFIRQVQGFATRYEGAILQLTIGDKGSYAYLNFGALSSHEDDARRVVKTVSRYIFRGQNQ